MGVRGQRQAQEAGAWLAAQGPHIDRALVSTARRARTTWERAASALAAPVPVEFRDDLYTFDAADLRDAVAGLPDDLGCVVVVGHDPALSDVASALAGDRIEMPTSCLAWFRWIGGWTPPAPSEIDLVALGRPPAPR